MLPENVTVAELAEVLGISTRRMQQLGKQGVFRKVAHGKYPLAASVQAYNVWKLKSEIDKRNSSGSADERLKAERERKLKLENDAVEAKMLPTGDAVAALDLIVGELRTELAGVPPRSSDDLEVRRRVEDAINDALAGVADRFAKVGGDLRAGRDPFAADQANEL